MHHHYADIRDRIAERPAWWDEYGVPRYGPFDPLACANIYAREVALVLIACQNCGTEFRVCMSESLWPRQDPGGFRAAIVSGSLHYGDPPNAGCCLAGPTMNCWDRRVLEFWDRRGFDGWVRVPELERALADGAEGADA